MTPPYNERFMSIYAALLSALADPLDLTEHGHLKIRKLAEKLASDVYENLEEE